MYSVFLEPTTLWTQSKGLTILPWRCRNIISQMFQQHVFRMEVHVTLFYIVTTTVRQGIFPMANSSITTAAGVQAIEHTPQAIFSANSHRQIVFFTDALSALQALKGGKLQQLSSALIKVAASKWTILCGYHPIAMYPDNNKVKLHTEEENVNRKKQGSRTKKRQLTNYQKCRESTTLDQLGHINILSVGSGHRLYESMYKLHLSVSWL